MAAGDYAAATPPEVAELLDDDESAALRRRVQRLLREGVLPADRTGRRYPWPPVQVARRNTAGRPWRDQVSAHVPW